MMTTDLDVRGVISHARSWIGTPYRDRAAIKGAGCDCLGLMVGLYRQVHGPLPVDVPPYRGDWADRSTGDLLIEAGRALFVERQPATEFAPGDVLIFRLRPDMAAKHIGIVSGINTMIHSYEKMGVIEVSLVPWWRRRIAAAFVFGRPLTQPIQM